MVKGVTSVSPRFIVWQMSACGVCQCVACVISDMFQYVACFSMWCVNVTHASDVCQCVCLSMCGVCQCVACVNVWREPVFGVSQCET